MKLPIDVQVLPAPDWCRFGGGWEWKVGVQTTKLVRRRGSVVVSLLVRQVRIGWHV